MSEQNNIGNNKRIAKNTLFLYIRLFLIMGVTLYTSRVILDKLGIEDYGLYNVVGGVVGMLSFLSGTLSIGTTRFITYELGTGNISKLKQTFNTSFYVHFGLAVIMMLLLETIGLWGVYNKLLIPENRFNAAIAVYHISIITMMVSVTQTPYTATIMAHEKMGVYAYISIFEAAAKLLVCFTLSYSPCDKLIFYAILLAVVQISVAFFYRIYCNLKFEGTKLSCSFDKSIFKRMMSFSGWNIIANIVETLKLQGVIVLMNFFFLPAIVGAQAFANHLSSSLMQFVNNFRNAINPQIIKLYASKDLEGSRKLTLSTTVYVFDLILLLGLPCIFVMPKILDIWLVEVPDYTVVFCQYIIIYNILSTFSASFYIPMMAAGKVKTNSLAGVVLGVGQFALLYVVLRLGGDVMWVQYLNISITIIFGFIVKPWILVNEVGYTYMEIVKCFGICAEIAICSSVVPVFLLFVLDMGNLWANVVVVIITFLSVSLFALCFMDKNTRHKLLCFLKEKVNIR